MPIYDYTCAACGHLTEVIHGMGEGGPRFCPSCGAEGTMRKGFAAPAVHFKGTGWAKKDRSATSSAGRSVAPKPADETGSAPSGGSGSESGNESGKGASARSSSGGTAERSSTSTGGSSAAATTADGGD